MPPRSRLGVPTRQLEIEFVYRDGRTERFDVLHDLHPRAAAPAPTRLPSAPFPPSVLRILADLRGADHYAEEPWTDERDDEVLADLAFVIAHGPQTITGLYGYLGWLRQQSERIAFIAWLLPVRNPERSDPKAKDFLAVGSTVLEEMLTIVHHLYVLHAHGLAGASSNSAALRASARRA